MKTEKLVHVATVPASAAGGCSACHDRTGGRVAEVLLGDPERTAVSVRLCRGCAEYVGKELLRQFKTVTDKSTVTCTICGKDCAAATAHLHQGQWIGDECCWDDRLRASE